MSGREMCAFAVAAASVELQRAIANRSQAKKARKLEFARYTDDRGYDVGYYPHCDGYGVDDRDDGCENAIATYEGAQRAVTVARGKWRTATTRYAKATGEQP